MSSSAFDFWPWLILAYFSLITLISSASTLLFGRALWLLRRLSRRDKSFRMAPSFVAFVAEMALLSVALALGGAVMVLNWRKDGYQSAALVFWAGVWSGCLLPAVPLGVLFLSLDRLLILRSPFFTHGNSLGLLSAGSVAALTVLHFTLNFRHHLDMEGIWKLNPADEEDGEESCWTFACLSSDFSISAYTIDRIALAVPNFVASVALLAMLMKRKGPATGEGQSREPTAADEHRRWRMGGKIALQTAILLLLFDLIPSVANLIATYGFDTNLSTVIGPYRQLSGALNTLGCALIYRQFFERQWKAERRVAPRGTSAFAGGQQNNVSDTAKGDIRMNQHHFTATEKRQNSPTSNFLALRQGEETSNSGVVNLADLVNSQPP